MRSPASTGPTPTVSNSTSLDRAGLDLRDVATNGVSSQIRDAFALEGQAANEGLAQARVIGDVNGDGIDDLLIGAPYGDGIGNAKAESGETYVVFGRRNWSGAVIDLSQVAAGTGGFVINGQAANVLIGDQSGVSA